MEENNFILDLIAALLQSKSKKQIKEDIKSMGDIKFPLVGTLSPKTKAQLKKDIASLDGTINLTGKVNSKGVVTSLQQATAQAQKQADSKPVEMSFSVKKDKLLNDIKLLARQNSKLFKDSDMTIKYNSLLDNAELARNTVELSALRTQLGSFRSELKVTGNAGLTMTDALKNGLYKVFQLFGSHGIIVQFTAQLRKAWTEAKELDKSMTDLSRVNSEITRSGFPDYLDKVISKTKQLAVATKDYIDAVTTFSRAGYNLADSETLAQAAVQLEKVGDMSAVDASKALLAGLQGYAEIDGYGMDQLTEKAQALNDKIDLVGNTASITQAELSRGIQAVGSVMNDANTSVDEFLALLGAGNRAVQDSDKVALAIRTSALRIRGCTAELEEMGEETDNVAESTSKLAEKIEGLTNINGSGGVKIFEEDEETFRSIFDIYNDIAKVYDKMSDKDASALLDLIAGKNRSNQISAILQNMSEANELLESSLSAAGIASKEYQIYLNSAEAATERFGVAMTEAYSNIISGDTVKGLANTGAAVLDFANSWNILEGTIKGFLALGILKGVTTLTVAFKNSALQISNYGKALEAVKKVSVYAKGTEDYANAMNLLKNSCVNLTDAQLKQVLANRNLSESQLIEILQLKKLQEEERNARLSQLGLIQTTEEQAVAQGAATASTFSFSAAIKGLGASIKTAWMTNPIGIVIMGISTAIGVATSAISKYNQQLEESRRANIESATTASENADKLKDLYNEYNRLASIQDRTTSEEEAFKTAVENITVALGDKAEMLKDLTAGTDEYADALTRVTKEELQSQAVTATIGRKSAEEEFQGKIWSKLNGSQVTIDSNDKGKALSNEAQKAVDIVSESLKEYETINRTWENISWDISSDDPTEALEYYNSLVEAREKLVLASEDDEALLDTEIYEDLNTAINTMSESLDTYIEKLYEEEKLNYMAQNGIPSVTEEYKAMESALVSAAGSSVDLQNRFKELLTSDFSDLATDIGNIGDAVGDASAQAQSAIPLFNQFASSEEELDKFQSSVKSATDAYSTLLSGDYSSTELLDSIQAINKAMSDMGGSLDWEFINSQTDSLELLGDAIQHISQKYAESILSGAGIDIDSEFGQMLANIIQQIYDVEAAFEGMNSQLDSLQSSYQTLTGILESYNETGYITLDNLQALLTADENLIQMLEVENGQLVLNQAAYENLVAVQLLEFKAKLNDAAAAEIETLAKQKAEQATNQNADASQNAVEKLDAETQAFNRNTSAAIANAVSKAESTGVSAEEIQGVFDKYTEVWNSAMSNYNVDFDSFMSGGKSAASKAGKEHADEYVKAFEKEYSNLKDMLNRGEISEAQYLNRLRALYNKYFRDRKKYLSEFKKYESEYLTGMLDLHNKALSGISTLLNRKISAANDAKDASISALQEEKEAAAEAYQAQIDAIEKEKDAIDDLIKEKNKKIASLNEEIDAIERAAESRKKNIQLEKDQYNLEKMLNNRSSLVYKDGQFIWDTDTRGIRDAREKVREDQEALRIDGLKNEISLIQKEIDLLEEKKDSLSEEQDRIQKLMDESNKYYDNLIKQQEKMWDSIIKGMEQNKSRWEELAEVEEIAKAFSYIQQVFGDLGYTVEDVLNGSDAAFEDFKSRYISLISDVNSNSDFTEGLVYATGVAKENLGSFLDKTKEAADGLDELGGKGSEMDSVAESMDKLSDSATTASTSTGEIASSMGELNTNTEGLTDNLNGVNDALTGIPEADKFDTLTTSFTNLGDAIKGVASALGVGEEGTVGGLVGALQSLSELSLGEEETGIVSQFNNLKTAVEGVTNAISGGGSSGGSKGGDASGSSSASMSAGAGGEGGSGSLVSAIDEFKSATDEALGGGGGEEGEGSGSGGTGAIPQFKELKTAVDDVTTAIGSGNTEGGESSGEGESDNLIGSIVNLGETSTETLGEQDGDGIIGKFNEFKGVIEEAANQVKSISEGLDEIDGKEVECSITVNVKMNGSVPAFASGTVLGNMQIESATYNAKYGKAFASGTIGLPKAEKNALRSEYGQPELTVYPNGTTELTTSPVMSDLPKGTVIYNEEETKKIMDNKSNPVGNAHADGTDDSIWTTLADGTKVRPLQPGDKMYDLQQKFEAYFKSIDGNVEKLVPNSLYEQNREWNKLADQISYANSVVNNRNVQPVINVGDVNVTCPGVTSQEVMREVGDVLGKQIGHLAQRAVQEPLHDY